MGCCVTVTAWRQQSSRFDCRGAHGTQVWRARAWEGSALPVCFRLCGQTPAAVGVALHGLAIAALTYATFATTAGVFDESSSYSAIFGSLAWLSLAAIIAMTAIRVTTYLRPNLAEQLPLPWKRFALLGVGYVLLTADGTIGSAINSPTSSLLVPLTLGIAATYIANIVRLGAESSESTRRQWFRPSRIGRDRGASVRAPVVRHCPCRPIDERP